MLIDGDDTHTAINKPRFHAVDDETGRPDVVHAEVGYDEVQLTALERAGYSVRRWDHLSHYFGGVSAVGLAGAGRPTRAGAASG